MLKVGVQSAGWYSKNDPMGSFRYIKECGFESIDFNIDHYLSTAKLVKEGVYPSFFDQSIEDILAFFTPAAPIGLSIGCLVFNLTFAAALPLDFLVGTLATYFAAKTMWLSRNTTIKGYPLFGMLMPALFNAILVGWELSIYIGGGFWLNAVYVAIGEIVVLLTLGSALYYAMKKRKLDTLLFG